jgi:hypothetical protein
MDGLARCPRIEDVVQSSHRSPHVGEGECQDATTQCFRTPVNASMQVRQPIKHRKAMDSFLRRSLDVMFWLKPSMMFATVFAAKNAAIPRTPIDTTTLAITVGTPPSICSDRTSLESSVTANGTCHLLFLTLTTRTCWQVDDIWSDPMAHWTCGRYSPFMRLLQGLLPGLPQERGNTDQGTKYFSGTPRDKLKSGPRPESTWHPRLSGARRTRNETAIGAGTIEKAADQGCRRFRAGEFCSVSRNVHGLSGML